MSVYSGTSGIDTDLAFDVVRRAGLDLGLVDNKVCAIDETWSACGSYTGSPIDRGRRR